MPRALLWKPAARERVAVTGQARTARLGETLRFLSWNIQYCGSRKHRFFYDGGSAVHVPAPDVRETLAAVSTRLGDVDVALLQEVDRGSDRTGRVDELAALGMPTFASASYHRGWIPYPWPPLRSVDLHLAIASRVRLDAAERIALPAMNEPRWRRLFNLRRGILAARIPVEGGAALHVAVTHLSAFTAGDDTLTRQVAVVRAWMEERERRGEPWLLAGDFNALPPGAHHPDEPPNRAMEGIPFRSLVHGETYQPFGAAPDRQYDYVFASQGLTVTSPRVERHEASDHLPLVWQVQVTGPGAFPPGAGWSPART
jgi:endonuclease/exonuclease/phosphatase family metal-dependent hydrolase